MADTENAYLTTRELAALLRIKERKVYDLAASGQIPCSRAMGKLLFPRKAIEAWIAGESINPDAVTPKSRPPVFLGSYEPLLEWALRESGCGLATLLDGSLDGLRRFVANEGVAAGLHVYDAADDSWNVRAVGEALRDAPVVLIEFAWRERGLIVAPGKARAFPDAAALRGHRVVPRQAGAGSQVLLEQLIADGNDGYSVRMALADLAEGTGDVAGMKAELQAAHRLDPSMAEPLQALVDLASKQKDHAAELDALKKLAKLEQHDPRVYRRLMERLLEKKQLAEARAAGEAATWADVEGMDTHRVFGEVLLASKMVPRAIFEGQSALLCPGRPKDQAKVHDLLARAYAAVPNPKQAAKHRKLAKSVLSEASK